MNLEHIHAGKVGVILGGGPSLEKDLKKAPDGAVFFAVNHYASELGIETDYTVYNDKHTVKFIKASDSKLVSRWREDADIFYPFETGVLSAILAVRLARHMGCAPILLCGMDCTGTHLEKPVPVSWYTNKWKLENPKDIRAVSGPLVKLFGKVGRKVDAEPRTVNVRILENKTVALNERQSVNFVRGVYDLPRHQAEAALAAGIAIKEKQHGCFKGPHVPN